MTNRALLLLLPVSLLFALGCGGIQVSEAAIAQNLRGAKALEEEALDDAEARFRLALELSPQFAEAHANLGLILARRGEYDAAIDELDLAVNLAPDLAAAHVGLGNVHATLGDVGAAIRDYERALAIQPEMVEPRRNLIRLLLVGERFADARAHALRLVQLEPARDESVALLAYAELRLGRPRAAIERIDGALAVVRPAPAVELVRALARLELGEVDAALAELERLGGDAARGGPARLRRAAILLDLGQIDAARRALRDCRSHGDDADALAAIEARIAEATRTRAPR